MVILLDTNVVLAYFNPANPFHFESKICIDSLLSKACSIAVPHIVIGEVIAHRKHLAKGSVSVSLALDILNKFQKRRGVFTGGAVLDTEKIISRYKVFSRKSKATSAGFMDFMIVAEAEELSKSLDVRLLTCDKGMYKCGKVIMRKRIYYLPKDSKGIKSDMPRLIKEVQNLENA